MEYGSPFFNHSHHQTKSSSDSDPLQEGNPNPSTNAEAQSDPINVDTGIEEQPRTPVVRDEEQRVPVVNLVRIMRRVLPPHVRVSDGAKETMQAYVSEFISFITSEANERCQQECRKIVTAEDLIWAMERLGFEDYIGPLVVYLRRYRRNEAVSLLQRSGGHVPTLMPLQTPPALHLQPPVLASIFPAMPIPRGLYKDGSGASGSRSGSGSGQL